MCLTTEKRTEMALARRNLEGNGGIACENARRSTTKVRKSPGPTYYANRINSPSDSSSPSQRSSPPRAYAHSPTNSDSVGKQYAGCKWTEPPSPSTLPQPPKHWTQSQQPSFFAMPFQNFCQPEQQDIAQQLKVLLKVQA